MIGTVIHSTGSYIPGHFIHNEDLNHFPESAKFRISQKTGVFARHKAAENEYTSDLAAKAAKNCLGKEGINPTDIQCIIVSTSSPDRMQPATATRVQHLIGAENAFAFDINSVCSGSTFGIMVADSIIKSKQCDNVLFIASEVYSRILNKEDFSTFPYFGDGAGAVLFTASQSKNAIVHSVLRTDGSQNETICVPGGGSMLPFEQMKTPKNAYFKMKGKAVFEFAVTKGSEVIMELLEKTGVAINTIKTFICHQANVNIILKIAEKLNVPFDNFYVNLYRYGNTASASVLISLDEVMTGKKIERDDLIITAAYGGGLSWGANLIHI